MPKSDQGIDRNRYQVVPRTLVFLFENQERVLLLRGADHKRLWAGLYNGVGGHIERGEDIYEAAYRELYEETGLTGIALRYCAHITVDVSAHTGVAIFVFKGTSENQDFSDSLEGVLSWVCLTKLETYPLVEDLPRLIPLIAAHQIAEPIIIGKYTYGIEGDLQMSFR